MTDSLCTGSTCGDAPDLREFSHRRFLRTARRAFLWCLLDAPDGTVTFDDLHDRLTVPPGLDPTIMGAVPRPLADAGIIRHVGYTRSCRKARHAGVTGRWCIHSLGAAMRWLETHKPIAGPDPEPGTVQADLFNGNEMPGAVTPGGNRKDLQ